VSTTFKEAIAITSAAGSGSTTRHIVVVLLTVTETLPIVLAVRLEVIRYKTVSVLRKGILAGREAISVASVIELGIEEALAIVVVSATAVV